MCRYIHKSLPFLSLVVICFLTVLFSHIVSFAQPGANNRGGQGGQGRGGTPGGGFQGAAPPGGGNMAGRPGFPGGGAPGGGFPGGGNMAGRPGFPGGGFPGGGFPGGGFPGGGNMASRPGLPGGSVIPGSMLPGTAFPQRQTSAATTTTSLVPAFGETAATSLTVPRFGESAEITPVATAVNYSGNTMEADLQRRINEQAQQLMSRYDRDKNGIIENSTGEWRNLSIDTNVADANRDGRITLDELRVYVGNQLRGGTSGTKVFVSYATTYQHMPEGIPAWFTDRDKDNDGQLTLFEYANGQPITEAMVGEFEWLDLNNDGIATLAECYSAIRTKEEMERKALEEQGGAVPGGNARGGPQDRRGGNNSNAAGSSFTPGADRQNPNAAGRNNQTRPAPGGTTGGGPGAARGGGATGTRGGGGPGGGAGGRGRAGG